ncbi:MAG: carbohydrate ABC transporter permease [Microbacterium sp.]|uniref:carbohydrate ABC transporter permease n=1 Tax=Microbacterium sp. TaxID=51671 RepID=UPI0039E6B4AE
MTVTTTRLITVPRAKQASRTTRYTALSWAKYTALALFAIPWILLPFWVLLVNSFKTEGEAGGLSIDLPTVWAAVENYTTVLVQGNYLLGLRNSILVAVPTIVLVLLLGTMAAWAYARSSSKVLKVTYYLSVLSIVLPPAIIPTVFVLMNLGINGTIVGYLLTSVGTRLGIITFLATGFVRTLPDDFEDAAAIDGANKWQIYWHVILPLLRPTMFAGAIMLVIGVWNDFFFALFLLRGSDSATLPLTLYRFASSSADGLAWNLVFAHVILTSLPLFIAYFALQRKVLAGLTDGGLTG